MYVCDPCLHVFIVYLCSLFFFRVFFQSCQVRRGEIGVDLWTACFCFPMTSDFILTGFISYGTMTMVGRCSLNLLVRLTCYLAHGVMLMRMFTVSWGGLQGKSMFLKFVQYHYLDSNSSSVRHKSSHV